ncbi:MAG TPA: type II secretion system F family protein [Pseudonocardiaceae bacterium]|nr:type II secretion system F family protein [Pseudonocardiaceae bacterium]
MLLIGVGTMAVLGGIVILTAMLLGIRLGSERGSRTRRKTSRYEFQPIHAVAVIAGLVALLLTRWVAIGVGVAGAVVLVPSLLAKSDAQHQITRLEALGGWTRRLGDLLASGAASSLDSALVKSAAVAPAAITSEVGALASRIGPQGSQAALMAFAKEMADPISDEVVMSLILQQRHGGRGLAAVLADLAAHVEDQIRMRREVEADRAKPRSNVRTIVLLTLGLSGGLILFDRTYLAPYGTVTGQLALAGVVAIFAAAVLWLRRMIRQMPGERLLVDADFAEQAQR